MKTETKKPLIPTKSIGAMGVFIFGVIVGGYLVTLWFSMQGSKGVLEISHYFKTGFGIGMGIILTAAGVNFVISVGDRATKALTEKHD